MTAARELSQPDQAEAILRAAMTGMAPAGIRLGCRIIRIGDENRLLPEEQRAVTTRDPHARRASGAGRQLARSLLADLGCVGVPVGRARSGRPVWPCGIVGSIAHDSEVAVAAVGLSTVVASLGIDVEPSEPLPGEVTGVVMTTRDEPGAVDPHLAGRIVFAAKEAVYKAVYPLDEVVLGHDDVDVDLSASCARTQGGHVLKLHWCVAPRIVVIATLAGGVAATSHLEAGTRPPAACSIPDGWTMRCLRADGGA